MIVRDLTELKVTTPEEIFSILSRSFRRRATSGTLMNQFSSRSHSVFTVHVRAAASTLPSYQLDCKYHGHNGCTGHCYVRSSRREGEKIVTAQLC